MIPKMKTIFERTRDRLSTVLKSHHRYSSQTICDNRMVKSFQKIPGPKGMFNLPYIGLLILGQSLGVLNNFEYHRFAACIQKRYGDFVKLRIKNKWALFVFYPDTAKEILLKKSKYPIVGSLEVYRVYNEQKKLHPPMISLKGEAWANLRRPTQEQMLRPAAVSTYVSIISDVASDFVDMFQKEVHIDDLKSAMSKVVTESTGMLCFNKRLGCLEGASVIDSAYLDDIFEASEKDLKRFGPGLYRYISTPLYRKFERAADYIFGVANTELKEATAKIEKAKAEGRLKDFVQGPSLLYALLTHPDMTPEMVQSVILDLFVAGVESTTNVLCFLWYELAKNPDKQHKLQEEIATLNDNSGITKETLLNMPYLKACVKEIMRQYPPSPSICRQLEEDTVINGYHVSAGTELHLLLQNICENPKYFKNPDDFVPERFLRDSDSEDNDMRNLYPYATLPFGIGARSCLGRRFAETEMYIITAKFFQRYNVSLPFKTNKKLQRRYRIFATPVEEIRLNIKQRSHVY